MRKLLFLTMLLLCKSPLLAQSVPTVKLSEVTAETSLLDLVAWRVTAYGCHPHRHAG